MITLLPCFDLARLVDGQLVTGTHTPGSLIPSWAVTNLVGNSSVRVCSGANIGFYDEQLAVLTDDGRILAKRKPVRDRLDDITPIVQDLFGADAANIQGIHVTERHLFVWSYSAVGVIHLGTNGVLLPVYRRQFPSEIDLISVSEFYCLVKTRDNRLFDTMLAIYPGQSLLIDEKSELAFHDVDSVTKIYTSGSWILLLMDNGKVYGCENKGTLLAKRPLARIQLPEDEVVVKIVDAREYIIYVTSAGNCYRQDTNGMGDWSAPVLVREVRGHVENVVAICNNYIVVQCSNSSSLKTYRMRFYTYMGVSIVETVPLPALDGMTVIAITRQAMHTCFVTNEGSVFWSYSLLGAEPVITRDPFFDSNLLAVECNAAKIRSAGSLLKNR